ncbi:5857_t:CDS:2 [Dentiscutata heterogama]|uniref:5857_t:CDS:1 n=1 Tax=Dentiscutata heterogama TaxID=1316150 RepID=A0ACA9K8P2_9GLOM|nr:5857_t:CDS:2 [Dentiscutata heterogama]
MSDYMFDGDAHDVHSLDYDELPRGEESHIDDESPRDEEPSQDKEFLKKRKIKKRKKRSNHSIAWDYFEMEEAEDGFVDICQLCKEKNITVKYAHDSSTGNMLGHLWSKHRIDKDHPNGTNTGGSIPFYEAITIFSGSTYSTLNLIYSTMRLLIKRFAPSDEQTEDDYADLLFEPREQINDNQSQLITDEEDSDEFNNEMPMISEKLRQPLCVSQGQRKKQNRKKVQKDIHKKYNDPRFKDQYWDVLEKTGLIASFLDPQIKNLKFNDDENVKRITIDTVWRLCTEEERHQPLAEKILKNHRFAKSSSMLASTPAITNDLVLDLYNNEESDNAYEETKPDMVEQMLFLKRNMEHFSIFKPDEL